VCARDGGDYYFSEYANITTRRWQASGNVRRSSVNMFVFVLSSLVLPLALLSLSLLPGAECQSPVLTCNGSETVMLSDGNSLPLPDTTFFIGVQVGTDYNQTQVVKIVLSLTEQQSYDYTATPNTPVASGSSPVLCLLTAKATYVCSVPPEESYFTLNINTNNYYGLLGISAIIISPDGAECATDTITVFVGPQCTVAQDCLADYPGGTPTACGYACSRYGLCIYGTSNDALCPGTPCFPGTCDLNGACSATQLPTGTPCSAAASSRKRQANFLPPPGPECGATCNALGDCTCLCSVDADCDDGNGCTYDSCILGTCAHISANGIACSLNGTAEAGDPCYRGLCSEAACDAVRDTTLPGCLVSSTTLAVPTSVTTTLPVQCRTQAECTDNNHNECQFSTCITGQCVPVYKNNGDVCNLTATLADKHHCQHYSCLEGTCVAHQRSNRTECVLPECAVSSDCHARNSTVCQSATCNRERKCVYGTALGSNKHSCPLNSTEEWRRNSTRLAHCYSAACSGDQCLAIYNPRLSGCTVPIDSSSSDVDPDDDDPPTTQRGRSHHSVTPPPVFVHNNHHNQHHSGGGGGGGHDAHDSNHASKCGDGHLDHGEQCDPGSEKHGRSFFWQCNSRCTKDARHGNLALVIVLVVLGVMLLVLFFFCLVRRRGSASTVTPLRVRSRKD